MNEVLTYVHRSHIYVGAHSFRTLELAHLNETQSLSVLSITPMFLLQ